MSRTDQESVKHRFRWIIDGATREKLERPELLLKSDTFSINLNGNKTQWKGKIVQGRKGYLRVAMNKYRVILDDFSLNLNFALNGVKHFGENKIKSSEIRSNWGWDDFIALDTLFDASSEFFRSDSKMEVVYDIELFHQNIEEDPPSQNIYTKLFNDTRFTDFTLISFDGISFKVHRTVLAVESEYFMKLMSNHMKEKRQGSVKFDDIDSETLIQVLDFIYNNKTEIDNVEKATKVIYAAEKFNLPGLKKICCHTLKDKLSAENAIEFFSIAHMYNEKELENSSLKIIIAKYDAVKQTEGWKSLTHPLLTKITDALIADSKIPQTTLYSSLHSR